jgi:transcriptional regulator with XRE-family HTH domain
MISHALFLERLYEVTDTTEQKVLAQIANVTTSAMSRYQTGQAMPSVETLARIAMVTEVSVDYLLGLTDDPQPPTRATRAINASLETPIQRGRGKPSPRPAQAKRK